MNILWLVPLFILLLGGFSLQVPEAINIGSIFSFDTVNGKVAKIAMNAAVEDINLDSSVLGGRKLVLSTHDSNYSGFLSIIGGKRLDLISLIVLVYYTCMHAYHLFEVLITELEKLIYIKLLFDN